jgi:hypothetical protein
VKESPGIKYSTGISDSLINTAFFLILSSIWHHFSPAIADCPCKKATIGSTVGQVDPLLQDEWNLGIMKSFRRTLWGVNGPVEGLSL